jgi:hypothetical protein
VRDLLVEWHQALAARGIVPTVFEWDAGYNEPAKIAWDQNWIIPTSDGKWLHCTNPGTVERHYSCAWSQLDQYTSTPDHAAAILDALLGEPHPRRAI